MTTQGHDRFHTANAYDQDGLVFEDGEGSAIHAWGPVWSGGSDRSIWLSEDAGGCFGVVLSGVFHDSVLGEIPAGWWFTTSAGLIGDLMLKGCMAVVQKTGHRGTDCLGRLEDAGRLRYIDGARDTALQAPWRRGEACLNALYVPNGVHQTMHTHPSTRIGIVTGGCGRCETRIDGHVMTEGTIFLLPTDGWHKFRTDFPDAPFLNLVAYHPDSTSGPTDEAHPMLDRTMIDGVSAANIPAIHTKP